MREKIVNRLRQYIPSALWPILWWLPALVAIAALPIGTLFLEALAYLEVGGAPRLLQLLMISSILLGPCVGVFSLLFVDFAGLDHRLTGRVKWLSRLAVVFPILFLLVLFLIFAKP